MKILVLVKQVPDDLSSVPTGADGTIDTHKGKQVIDPVGKNAVEAAVSLKEKVGGEVTTLAVGPATTKAVLKETISVGADKGVQIVDESFDGTDPFATAQIAGAAAQKLGPFDLIITGVRSYDSGSGLVAPALAAALDLPLATALHALGEADETALHATQVLESGTREITVKYPAVISVDEYVNKPRYASVKTKLAANKAKFDSYSAADLSVSDPRVPAATPSSISEVETRSAAQMITGDSADDIAGKIAEIVKNEGLV